MNIAEILTIVGLFLAYGVGLISVYVDVRVKIKALEVEILNIKKEVEEHKNTTRNDIQRLADANTQQHDNIIARIDMLVDKFTDFLGAFTSKSSTIAKGTKNHKLRNI